MGAYAAGDAAASGPPLTPVSAHDAKIVAANMLDGADARPDYCGMPSVAFTMPPIASIGLSEADARAKGLRFRANAASVPKWFTARRLNEAVYGYISVTWWCRRRGQSLLNQGQHATGSLIFASTRTASARQQM